jgi:histidinol-phosphate phosphatase family protein
VTVTVDIVIPTAGRESLRELLEALAPQAGELLGEVVVVDDRRDAVRALPIPPSASVRVVRGSAAGPAAARNRGWRAARAEWVAFLDDDVIPEPGWARLLRDDLAGAGPEVAAVQGRISVPRPPGRRPTDWERNVAGLERARWATADMAYRRADLAAVGGFDERFKRAYREDADLGLRTVRRGRAIVSGSRRVLHPARPAPWSTSLRLQAGNADDVLMRALHGSDWREAAGAPAGRLRRHLATAVSGAAGLAALGLGRPALAVAAGSVWGAGTAELAWARIQPGPRTADEVARMLVTSLLMPFVATAWRAAGAVPTPELGPRRGPAPPAAVLLDRDGTLIEDRPYDADPARVVPMPGARPALDRLRRAGVRLAVVSNQSGVGRGLISARELAAVNRRVEELLGPLGPWLVCLHAPEDGCDCRKPAPGLVLQAAERLGVAPADCVVVGDIGADVEAARAAGARAVLVPTPKTRGEELLAAPATARDLGGAVDLLLGARP